MLLRLFLFFFMFTGRSYEQQERLIHSVVNKLLFELDNVMDDGEIQFIPDDLREKCTMALTFLSTDGREDSTFSPSTPQDHADADRLMTKLQEVHLELDGSILDRNGFMRDVFSLNDQQWMIAAVQYYSFIDYYDNPIKPNAVFKLLQWTVYPADYKGGFAPAYHLERSHSKKYGFTYMLGRKLYPHYHESLIHFFNRCPSYMELKPLIIGDVTGEAPLPFIISSGYRE